MDSAASSSAPNHAELPYLAICEDRALIRSLLFRWMEQSLPCRLSEITHPQAIDRDHFNAKMCLISARTAPY
jgi:hypothetical protein